MVSEVAADFDQFIEGPAVPGLAVGAGIILDGARIREALVIGLDLADSLAAAGAGSEDLVQKGQEGEFGGEVALAAVVPAFIGSQEGLVNPGGGEGLEVMKGALALEGPGRVLEWGVEFAEERSSSKHISVVLQISA